MNINVDKANIPPETPAIESSVNSTGFDPSDFIIRDLDLDQVEGRNFLHYRDRPLGHYAVKISLEASQNPAIQPEIVRSNGALPLSAETPRSHRERMNILLAEARTKLRHLNRPDPDMEVFKGYINQVIQSRNPSKWLDAELGFTDMDPEDKDYVAKFAEVRIENGYAIPVIPNDMFLNFLQWYHYELASEQREFNDTKEILLDSMKQNLRLGIAKGWIPKGVGKRFDRLDTTLFVIDDGFNRNVDTQPAQSIRGIVEKNLIVLEPKILTEQADYSRQHLILHEIIHVLQGYNTDPEKDESGLYRLFDQDLAYTLTGVRALNEAVVEHLTFSLSEGLDIDDTEAPAQQDEAFYKKARQMLNALCNRGKHTIDIRLFIAAHFEHDEGDKIEGVFPSQLLEEQLKSAFPGMNVLEEIANIQNHSEIDTFIAKIEKLQMSY